MDAATMLRRWLILLVCIRSYSLVSGQNLGYDDLYKSTADLIRSRGYFAEEHFITTTDGYILEVVRGTNLEVNGGKGALQNKEVILFIHGIFSNANLFMINSIGAESRDYSKLNASQLSQTQLEELLANDPARNSIALQAMNFGHEIWMLNRRGVMGSTRRTSGKSIGGELKTKTINPMSLGEHLNYLSDFLRNSTKGSVMNSNYFNYTLDNQAKYDIPECVYYICKYTGRQRITVIGHSAGGALTVMALANQPDLADKVSKSILYSPAFNLGGRLLEFIRYNIIPLPPGFIGSVPPSQSVQFIRTAIAAICSNAILRGTLCKLVADIAVGLSSYQQQILPGFINGLLSPTSIGELTQLEQCSRLKSMHYFDYENQEQNRRAYGSELPPPYNASSVRLRTFTLWATETDGLVGPPDVLKLRQELKVPTDLRYQPGVNNHLSYFLDKDSYKLFVIPSLQVLDS